MNFEDEIKNLIGQPENEQIEYKAVLPPARTIALNICSFANTKGGVLVLGISDRNRNIQVTGLSEDFHVGTILEKALSLLNLRPTIENKYVSYEGKTIYAIKVDKSDNVVLFEGQKYIRISDRNVPEQTIVQATDSSKYVRLKTLSEQFLEYRKNSTDAMSKIVRHYQSVLNVYSDLSLLLYPETPKKPTTNPEGKILSRILFSSCADNFETYLSDLLFEIYLAKPDTLKSDKQVSVKEVLDCSDIQEFISFYAKKKIGQLKRGSVKNFISENNQISSLKAIDETRQAEIEKILQIRHLYAHNNGIVDEKFLKYFPTSHKLNDVFELSIDETLDLVQYLLETVELIDKAAILEYNLSTSN